MSCSLILSFTDSAAYQTKQDQITAGIICTASKEKTVTTLFHLLTNKFIQQCKPFGGLTPTFQRTDIHLIHYAFQ
jgi:hypothetical protein